MNPQNNQKKPEIMISESTDSSRWPEVFWRPSDLIRRVPDQLWDKISTRLPKIPLSELLEVDGIPETTDCIEPEIDLDNN